jgi:parallel beta-helix repeat protein
MMAGLLALLGALIMVTQVMAGIWTPNDFLYKPAEGARGALEKAKFDSGLDQVDSRLGKERWLGDPGGTPGYSTLANALTTISTNQVTLRIPVGTVAITTDTTIPANITLKLGQGAVLAVATTKTLTINGGLEAGLYPIFSCTGTGKVNLTGSTKIQQVYPQWWGATGNGTTDDTLAVAKAVASVETSDIPVFFPKGSYLLTRQGYFTDAEVGSTTQYYAVKSTGKIIIRGDRATIKVSATDAAHTTAFAVVGTSGSFVEGAHFSGLDFVGVGSPTTDVLYVGPPIILKFCRGATISGITMDSTRSGLSVRNSHNCLLDNIQRWVPAFATPLLTSHVAFWHSTECTLRDSSFWGIAQDADVLLMGATERCIVQGVKLHAYAKGDATRTIANVNGDGIDVDAGASRNKVSGCYVYGYYYGISARSSGSGNIITGNVVEKCKVGISAWYGTNPPGEQENTIIANNVIHPEGGQSGADWWGTFTSVGIGLDKPFGVTVEGNYIGNTLPAAGTAINNFVGIACMFGDTVYSEWHQNGCNITNNRIVMLNGHSGKNAISTIWAMYFIGSGASVATYQHGLNVQGNQIKVNQHSNSTTPVIYGIYLNNFNFSNNMFTGQFNSDFPIMDICNSNMVDISDNHFPTSTKGDVINLNTVNGSRVTGNTLGAYGVSGGSSRKFIRASNVKDLQISNNHKYYSGQSNETQFVQATGLDYFTAIGNHANLGWGNITNWLNLSGRQIEGMTRAPDCVVTWNAHGKQSGDTIKFAEITQADWAALNGNEYTITYIGANTFSIPVNTSEYAGDYVPATAPGTYWFQEIGHNQITNRIQ